MKKILLALFISLLLHGAASAQTLTLSTPDPLDQCAWNSGIVNFTVVPYDSTATYEWAYDTYQFWYSSGYATRTVLGYGQTMVYDCHLYPEPTTRITCTKFNQGNPTGFGSTVVRSSTGSILISYHIEQNSCNSISVPVPYCNPPVFGGPYPATPGWYKDGVAMNLTDCTLLNPDSGMYEYRVQLTCGDYLTTTGISITDGMPHPVITPGGPLTFCQGSSVTLSVNSQPGWLYQWQKNGVNIGGATNYNLIVSESGSYTVSVGTASGCNAQATPVVVTMLSAAVITTPDPLACIGDTITLSSTSAGSYLWKLNGITIPGATQQTYKATQTGTYTVVTTGMQCNTSFGKAIIFLAAPTISIAAAGSLSIWPGTGVGLTATASNATYYQWYQNGTAITGEIFTSLYATQAGAYKCIVTNAGCEVKSNIKTISLKTANQLPSKTIILQPDGITGKDASVGKALPNSNYGSTVSLFAACYLYQDVPQPSRSYLQFDLSVIPPGTIINNAKLNLYGTNVGSNVPVNSTFIDPVRSAWNEGSVNWSNQPEITTYNRVSIAGTASPNQNWLNINMKGAVVGMVNNPVKNNGWRLWLQNEPQTGNMSVASSDHATASMHPKLVVSYAWAKIDAAGSLTFCSGDSVALTTNAGPYTYKWKKNGVNISGANAITYYAKASGNYSVVITDPNGALVESTQKTVTVKSLPSAAVTAQGPLTFCAGDSVKLQASTGTGYSYKWKKNNTTIGGANLSSYTAKTAGSYKTVVTSSAGCSKTSPSVTVSVPCRMSDTDEKDGASATVYPNPAFNRFTIQLNNNRDELVFGELYDISGKKIGTFTFDGNESFSFGSGLGSGTYLLKVYNSSLNHKMVIVKY